MQSRRWFESARATSSTPLDTPCFVAGARCDGGAGGRREACSRVLGSYASHEMRPRSRPVGASFCFSQGHGANLPSRFGPWHLQCLSASRRRILGIRRVGSDRVNTAGSLAFYFTWSCRLPIFCSLCARRRFRSSTAFEAYVNTDGLEA